MKKTEPTRLRDVRINEKHLRRGITLGKAIIGLLLFILLFNSAIFIVPAGHGGVLFSRIEGGVQPVTYGEGWHFKIPIVESASVQEVRIRKIEITASSASKDLQEVSTTIALNYHLSNSQLHIIFKSIGWEYDSRIVKPAIEESVKAVTARYTAEELITRRGEVSSGIKDLLSERLALSHILADYFSIVNFEFSSGFNTAIEAKQVAEQDALRELRVLEKIEILAQQRIAEAEGIKQSDILKAEGRAVAKIKVAEAEAYAIEVQGIALKDSPTVLTLRQIERWDGKVPLIMGSNALPIINLNQLTGTNSATVS